MVVVDTTTIVAARRTEGSKEAGRRSLLAEFLRTRRARLSPAEVGLPAGTHRRVPGLRREEVAVLADVGITWYTWLEQGRPIRMAPATLERIAAALRLDRHERAYLSRLVAFDREETRWNVPLPARVGEVVRAYAAGPAYVLGPRWDVLAWNEVFARVFGFPGSAASETNALRHTFLDPRVRHMLVDWPAQAQRILAAFRTSYARHVGDPAFEELVAELTRASAEFARLWSESTVLSPTEARSARVHHPTLGAFSYDTVTFLIPEVPEATVIFGMLDPAEPPHPPAVTEAEPAPR